MRTAVIFLAIGLAATAYFQQRQINALQRRIDSPVSKANDQKPVDPGDWVTVSPSPAISRADQYVNDVERRYRASRPWRVLSDPDFQGLPIGERLKVMRTIDPSFSGLPPGEQEKVVNFKPPAQQGPR
jgi:hypothetical protein